MPSDGVARDALLELEELLPTAALDLSVFRSPREDKKGGDARLASILLRREDEEDAEIAREAEEEKGELLALNGLRTGETVAEEHTGALEEQRGLPEELLFPGERITGLAGSGGGERDGGRGVV